MAAAVLGGLETLDLNYGVWCPWQQYPSGFIMENGENRSLNMCFTGFYPVHLTVLVLIRAGFLGFFRGNIKSLHIRGKSVDCLMMPDAVYSDYVVV